MPLFLQICLQLLDHLHGQEVFNKEFFIHRKDLIKLVSKSNKDNNLKMLKNYWLLFLKISSNLNKKY